jgi:hypothetical protein
VQRGSGSGPACNTHDLAGGHENSFNPFYTRRSEAWEDALGEQTVAGRGWRAQGEGFYTVPERGSQAGVYTFCLGKLSVPMIFSVVGAIPVLTICSASASTQGSITISESGMRFSGSTGVVCW